MFWYKKHETYFGVAQELNTTHTAQKMKLSINDFFSKSDQICRNEKHIFALL